MSYKPLTTEERLAPFLALLEARYAPLLCSVAPQAYAVFLWLWEGSNGSWAAFIFSILGALGYESVYVGAIAWTLEGRKSAWTWATSFVALAFSVLVAGYVYFDTQGWWALLHSGFPLVGFCYTMALHSQQAQAQQEPAATVATSKKPVALPLPTQEPVLNTLLSDLKADSSPIHANSSQPTSKPRKTVKKASEGPTKRSRVRSVLDEHGNLKDSELYELLPDVSQSSVRVHASEWRKEQLMATNGNGKH